jgi:cytochrome P450/nitrite reductase/ring-hydroxylating ferredoxin subunit
MLPAPSVDESSATWTKAASVAEVLEGRPFGTVVEGADVVLVRQGTEIRAFEGRCPHQGTLLAEGDIDNGELVCRAHLWRFDCVTGERKKGPPSAAKLCLRSYPTKLEGGAVLVQIGLPKSKQVPVARAPRKATRKLADLPGPRGLPVVGNIFQIRPESLHQILERWSAEYGPIYRFRMLGRDAIVVADATISEEVLRARPQAFRRMSLLEPIFDELGVSGVFSAEGNSWRQQRRLAMEALSNRNTRASYSMIRKVAERLRERWNVAVAKESVLEIQEDLMRFTVDVTTSLVFDIDMNTLGGGEDVLQRQLEHVFPALARRITAPFPYWRWVKLPADRKLDRALDEIRVFLRKLVKDARARIDARPEAERAPKNFLEAMLLARDEDGKPYEDAVLYGNLLTMLLAGEDTTANSIAWAVHYLCERPDIVARARTEIDTVLGDELTPPDIERASRLPYLDAIANEGMRLRPVAPFLGLEANEDVVVGDVAVPKGSFVDLLTRPPGMSPQNFDRPTEFRPERWLSERAPDAVHVANATIPFGSGPRICPGRSLAILEMRVVLATLMKNFDFERIGRAEDVGERFSFTMLPAELRVRLRSRTS